MALPLVTQPQLVEALAKETGYSKSDIRHVLKSLDDVVCDAISECKRVKIGTVVQIEPKLRKAQKARMGRNPQTGEDVPIAKKPASVRIAARILKPAKDAAPTTNQLRARLSRSK
jgi:nucleoid DNA-binding protein